MTIFVDTTVLPRSFRLTDGDLELLKAIADELGGQLRGSVVVGKNRWRNANGRRDGRSRIHGFIHLGLILDYERRRRCLGGTPAR